MISTENPIQIYADLLQKGQEQSPRVAEAIAGMRLRQQKIKDEQKTLLNENKQKWKEDKQKPQEETREYYKQNLVEKVRSTSERDRKLIETFTREMNSNPNKETLPFAVRTHKMEEIFVGNRKFKGTGTLEILKNDEDVLRMAKGQFPLLEDLFPNGGWNSEKGDFDIPLTSDDPIVNQFNTFPILGSGTYWGTSKVSYVSCALLSVTFSHCGKTIQDLPLDSAITHVAPLPKGFALDPHCRFSYKIQDAGTSSSSSGFGYVHSGYSFGGHRGEESLYKNGKALGPEDCSSWVAKITGCPHLFSTADQLCTQRTLRDKGKEFLPTGWDVTDQAKDMCARYQPIEADQIQPGDVYFARTFDPSTSQLENLGKGGHTALILSKREKSVVTLAYARDMPTEGFGIQVFPIESTPEKLVQFQRVREGKSTLGL